MDPNDLNNAVDEQEQPQDDVEVTEQDSTDIVDPEEGEDEDGTEPEAVADEEDVDFGDESDDATEEEETPSQ